MIGSSHSSTGAGTKPRAALSQRPSVCVPPRIGSRIGRPVTVVRLHPDPLPQRTADNDVYSVPVTPSVRWGSPNSERGAPFSTTASNCPFRAPRVSQRTRPTRSRFPRRGWVPANQWMPPPGQGGLWTAKVAPRNEVAPVLGFHHLEPGLLFCLLTHARNAFRGHPSFLFSRYGPRPPNHQESRCSGCPSTGRPVSLSPPRRSLSLPRGERSIPRVRPEASGRPG